MSKKNAGYWKSSLTHWRLVPRMLGLGSMENVCYSKNKIVIKGLKMSNNSKEKRPSKRTMFGIFFLKWGEKKKCVSITKSKENG